VSYDPERTEKSRQEQRQRSENERLDEQEDIRWLMNSPRGRRFMHRLLGVTGVYRCSFTGNSETFFREGARSVGLRFLADIQDLAPEDFVKMLTEHREPNNGQDRTN